MKVHELLSSSDKWTKGAYARNKDGWSVSEDSNEAVCFCLSGALFRVYGDYANDGIARRKIHDRLYQTRNRECILSFNDDPETTYEDVYNLVKELDV